MKTIRKTIRFSKEEWQIIINNIDQISISFSQFARASILHSKVKIISKTDEKMIFEINKIGVNLNQITKKINEEKIIDLQVLKEIKIINEQISELLS